MSWSNQLSQGPRSMVRSPSRSSRPRTTGYGQWTSRAGFTLVEMLIAMAITLVMIGAVVTLFANISTSVRGRRATIEMSGQVRHVRNMLQQDLQGATCPGLTWQRPEENQGYIEIIEGQNREGQASILIDGIDEPGSPRFNPEIDHTTSIIPTSNLPLPDSKWATDGAGLGDADDTLMLTVRNEHEPFIGKVPKNVRENASDAQPFVEWEDQALESPLAEVVWYAVENPDKATNDTALNFFGEPGMRTIYRRTLLIAPFINPYRFTDPNTGAIVDTFQLNGTGPTFKAEPGLVRILPAGITRPATMRALAALVAFQERYDLSVRLEFDPLLGANGRWKIVANTLGDLTKRENRYEHYSFRPGGQREYPYASISAGSGYTGTPIVQFVQDSEYTAASPNAQARANLVNVTGLSGIVASYEVSNLGDGYGVRPFAYVNDSSSNIRLATARAMLNDDGEVIRVVHGLVPLSRERRGEDVMLTDALAFDLRVYDPGAPLFGETNTETVLEPTDPGWTAAYVSNDNMKDPGSGGAIGNGNGVTGVQFPYVGQGAFVDLGYGYDARRPLASPSLPALLKSPVFATAYSSSAIIPWFFAPRGLSDIYENLLAPGYAVYDTWSFHYENDGLNEDHDQIRSGAWQGIDDGNGTPLIDEGTNGLDDVGHYSDGDFKRLGPDDVGERETTPPYDKPLRAVQVVLRLYETDSRQIRQTSVNQSFVPE